MVDVVVDCFFEVDVQFKYFMEGVLTPCKEIYKNMQKKSKQSNVISFFTKSSVLWSASNCILFICPDHVRTGTPIPFQ
jgi:hypothetical protein